MSQITEYLFLGNESDSRDITFLKKNKITHIINATRTSPNYFPEEFDYLICRIGDDDIQAIEEPINKCCEFIKEAVQEKGKILVHCRKGISRSPSLVISFLIIERNMTLKDALTKVKTARPIVLPNYNFIRQLQLIELNLTDSITLTFDEYKEVYERDELILAELGLLRKKGEFRSIKSLTQNQPQNQGQFSTPTDVSNSYLHFPLQEEVEILPEDDRSELDSLFGFHDFYDGVFSLLFSP